MNRYWKPGMHIKKALLIGGAMLMGLSIIDHVMPRPTAAQQECTHFRYNAEQWAYASVAARDTMQAICDLRGY
jgi:hypothetical protein